MHSCLLSRMDMHSFGIIFCLQIFYVNGWQCPTNQVNRSSYIKTGEQAVIGFQTTLRNYHRTLVYSVTNHKGDNLYAATFYKNVFKSENVYLGSEFIGNAGIGNFTIKTAAVKQDDGGMYLLQYKEGTGVLSTLECLKLYILGKPKKATITQDNNNILGRDSRLTCNSLSTTYPTNHTLNLVYNWKVNNVTNPSNSNKYVYSTSRNQLTIKAVSKEDANTRFTCSASESGSSITGLSSYESDLLTFQVIYGPDADTTRLSPPNTQYTLNEGVTLPDITCSGECYPRCNYEWLKSGTTVNNRAVLSLGQLFKTDASIYTCEVTNSNSTTISEIRKQVTVNVIYGPDADSLKLNPSQSSYTENKGTSLNDITCSAACYPNCIYTWTKFGSQFIESDILSLGTLDKDKAATYTCTAYNPTTKHNISTSVIVHVRFGPTECRLNVTSQYNLTEGRSSSEMTCQAECYPECTYLWTNMSSSSSVGTNGKFQLINSKRYEAGTYKCLCENKPLVKSQSSSVVITIHYPPDVTVLQSTTNITEGNNLTLTCDAKGVPSVYRYNSLTQTWNGVPIPNTNSEKIGKPKYSSLYIPSLQLQDSGTYSCFVNNGVNATDSTSSVKIKVKGFPKVLTGLLTFIGKTGDETNVSIQFYSFPEIQDVIFKSSDDKVMKNDTTKKHIVSHHETVVKDKFYGKEVSLIGRQANLVFKKMIPDDFGGYTLILKNEIGEISTQFEIKSESEPSIPTGFTYEKIDGIHSLSWVSGFNGGNRQTFIIQMSLSDQDSWQNRTSITEELGVKNFIVYSVNMSDLTPGTYKARIYAWNKNGYSDYVILNGTITITKQEPGEAPFPVGIVAGVVSSVVALGIAAAIGFFVLRRLRTKDESRSKLNSRSGTGDEDSDDEDEVNTVNPMYVSADEVKSGTSANNEKKKDDVYAMVDKKPKKTNVGLDNLYAMPEKKDVKKRKKDKPKKETGGDVYENAPVNAIGSGKKTAYEENPYENPEISDTRKAPLRNKDGLIYADLAFNDQPKGQKKLVIHGLDDMTEYVEVDFTKRADPLPDSDEENK